MLQQLKHAQASSRLVKQNVSGYPAPDRPLRLPIPATELAARRTSRAATAPAGARRNQASLLGAEPGGDQPFVFPNRAVCCRRGPRYARVHAAEHQSVDRRPDLEAAELTHDGVSSVRCCRREGSRRLAQSGLHLRPEARMESAVGISGTMCAAGEGIWGAGIGFDLVVDGQTKLPWNARNSPPGRALAFTHSATGASTTKNDFSILATIFGCHLLSRNR